VIQVFRLRSLLPCLLVALAATASAHGLFDRAEPRPGSRVRTSPTHVSVWFTERLEAAYSRVQVLNDKGERADANDSRVESADARQLRVSVPPLAAGTYKVVWRVLSVDGHLTEGEFTFRVTP
jgi:methionine-rich copper-binding protein CopC